MLKTFLPIVHITVSLLLITAILLQSKGVGLGGAFGGGGEIYQTKRGAEKAIFILTIILAAIFVSISLTEAIFP